MNAPGIHFFYDFYPVMVEYTHRKTGFLQFLTSVFAVVGGIFTISRCVCGCGVWGWMCLSVRVGVGLLVQTSERSNVCWVSVVLPLSERWF